MNFFDGERIHDRERVAPEAFDGIGSLIGHACAMSARIIAHDPEMLEQDGELRVPKVEIGAKRIRKHQDRFVLVTLNENVEDLASDGNFGHAQILVRFGACANQTKCDHESLMMTQSWSKTCAPGDSPSRAVAQINKLFAKRTELSESCRTDSSGARLYAPPHLPGVQSN